MFKLLQTINDSESPTEGNITISQEQFNFLVANLSSVPASTIRRNERNRTRRELKAIISAIETYGVSPALLAFANYNGVLGKAVPAIPSVEALSTDSVIDAENILLELKSINIEDVANEKLGTLQWIAVILGFLSSIIGGIILYVVFTSWNDNEDRKKNEAASAQSRIDRMATVTRYSEVVDYLNAVIRLPSVLKGIISIHLPENHNQYHGEFLSSLDNTVDHNLKDIRVSLDDEYLYANSIGNPVHGDIVNLGYTEGSLSHIASLAKRCESIEQELRDIQRMLSGLKPIDKNDESQKYSSKAIRLIEDVTHVSLAQTVKILQLAKHTCDTIKHFYKQG